MKTTIILLIVSIFVCCQVSSSFEEEGPLRSSSSSSTTTTKSISFAEDESLIKEEDSLQWTNNDLKKKTKEKNDDVGWPHWHWPDGKKKKDDVTPTTETCAMQGNCTSCLLHSSLCQWCDSTSSCHNSLSIHGCWHSNKCYTNQKCHRVTPEPARHFSRNIPRWFTRSLFVITAILLASLTCTYATISSFHHAYLDIVRFRNKTILPNHNNNNQESLSLSSCEEPIDQKQQDKGDTQLPPSSGQTLTTDHHSSSDNDLTQPLLLEDHPFIHEQHKEEEEAAYHLHHTHHLDTNNTTTNHDNKSSNINNNHNNNKKRKIRTRGNSCIFGMCSVCYLMAVMIIISCTSFLVWIYPQVPELNICSDEIAWKSIIQGLESMHLEASFGILMSVHNPNRFPLSMDNFNGLFHHNGKKIGSYQIESTTFAPMSITDVTMTCTFSPDKWEAMTLATDYYRGNLVLQVNAQGTIILSQNIHLPINMGDISINATDYTMDDRHLCACPKWSDAKKHHKQHNDTYPISTE